MNPLIFDRPNLQSFRERYGYGLLTFLFWLVWVYLWLPLVSLLAWVFGVRLFYENMILHGGYQALLEILWFYAVSALCIATVLIGWATINLIRFRNRERRSAATPVTVAQLARDFSVDADALSEWQRQGTLRVSHDSKGGIALIEPGSVAKVLRAPLRTV